MLVQVSHRDGARGIIPFPRKYIVGYESFRP